MNADFKFPLCNYKGVPLQHLVVEAIDLEAIEANPIPALAHHILILDRSGSMYQDIEALRTTVVKILTLDDYHNPDMLASVISYSSAGDMTVHASRVRIGDLMANMNAEPVKSILEMRVTGLTCMSQALEHARTMIVNTETTCVTVHSDGYANDRSAGLERQAIDAWIESVRNMPMLYVNTIAYRPSSDFQLLSHLANSVSGKCVQANNIQEVYDAIHDTQVLLDNGVAPALTLPIGDGDFLVFVDMTERKVVGSTEDLLARGFANVTFAYRYTVVDEKTYSETRASVASHASSLRPIFALIDAAISLGKIHTAKYAMVATRSSSFIEDHMLSVTSVDLAHMQKDARDVLCSVSYDYAANTTFTESYGVPNADRPSILDLCKVFDEHAKSIRVDVDHLRKHYSKRSVKRIPGYREKDGTLTEPTIASRRAPRDANPGDHQFVRCEFNRKNATVNLLLSQPMQLVDLAGTHTDEPGQILDEIAGIPLDKLNAFNNYTLVSDGRLNLSSIRIRTDSFKLWRKLAKLGVVAEDDFVPELYLEIELADFAVFDIDLVRETPPIDAVFNRVAKLKTLKKLLSASIGKKSSEYSPDQIEALASIHMTPRLNFSPPMTTVYTDFDEAVRVGEIDFFTRYEIDVGTTNILHTGQLRSGNELLKRFVKVIYDDNNGKMEVLKNPTLDQVWSEGVAFEEKKLSKQTKITEVDLLMRPILFDFLGMGDGNHLEEVLNIIDDLPDETCASFLAAIEMSASEYDRLEAFEDVLGHVDRAISAEYEALRPLVYYVGSTGLVPEDMAGVMLNAKELGQMFDVLKIGKNERGGSFFLRDHGILSVYAKSVPYTSYTEYMDT
jgi:hypothetical protein